MKVKTALVLILWSCPFLVAQEHSKYEIFGGYSLEHISTCGSDDASCSYSSDGPADVTNFNGWNVSLSAYLHKFLGFTADFSGHRGTSVQVGFPASVSRYSYLFGPAVAIHTRNVTPFGHVLFGGVSNNYTGSFGSSYSVFAWAAGGGLDANMSRHFAVRLAELDYERVRTPGGGSLSPVSGTRFSCGLVFRF